jgi:glycosyltransferase involved in cell wall biosynthesis
MMTDESIVCFAKDWSEDPTSNNHVMKMLARDNKVLWLNSISTRTPDFRSGRDLDKIARKLKSFARGPVDVALDGAVHQEPVTGGLHVYTPIVLPFPHSRAAAIANSEILRGTVRLLRGKYRMQKDFQLWSFIPTAVKYVGKLGESLVVYYCTDEWSHFSYVDGAKIVAMEKELCERADIVFTTAKTLLERKKEYNPETHLASHGVDYAHFAKALDPSTEIADEVRDVARPVIGFVGLLQDWIDTDCIEHMAKARPSWTFVIIGKALVDVSRLDALPNVRMLGRKAYPDLPTYMRTFDMGLIPFRLNELTRNVNPIKLREYFSAGLPVVSSDIPEVRAYADFKFGDEHGALGCGVYRSPDEALALCEKALAHDSPGARRRRSDAMRAETWEKKVEALGEHIARVKANKRGRA